MLYLRAGMGRNLRSDAVRATGHVALPFQPGNNTKEPSACATTGSQQSDRFISYARVLFY